MPGIATKARELKAKFYRGAPKANQPKIEEVIDIYRNNRNVSFRTTQNVVLGLYSPSLVGRTKAERDYQDFIKAYANTDEEAPPEGLIKVRRQRRKMEDELARLKGEKKKFQLEAIFYTKEEKRNRADFVDDTPAKDEEEKKRRKIDDRRYRRRHKGLSQYAKRDLDVEAPNDTVIKECKWRMITRGDREFKSLYQICLTDPNFKQMQHMRPGYLDAIYIKEWTPKRTDGAVSNPRQARQRTAGDKVAIEYKYCSTQLDLTKQTFREALRKSNYNEHECFLNAIVEQYSCEKGLLDPKKTQNIITRETILELLGRTEEDIKEGLTIDEVLPFFVKYKLKLRVYDLYYNLIHKHDPEVPNFNNKPMYCLTDGNHIYLLDKDLESLAQMTKGDEYKVVVGSDFRTPDKPVKADHKMIEHIDELLDILRESDSSGQEEEADSKPRKKNKKPENITQLVQKYDNLNDIVWQLYKAGQRPSIRDGAGKLSWVSFTVNKHTFIVRSQNMREDAIDGIMEIHEPDTYNRMHDARMDFHYQLFKNEHKSYYTQQDLDILNECRTTANVGWLTELPKGRVILPTQYTRKAFRKADLAEIDQNKAFTAAFMKIRAVPVFNEFDTWQPYTEPQPLRDLSLYLVEAKELDLFFNKRYCLCYGLFLKQLGKPTIHAVKHPSVIKKVSYLQMVEELWKTPISDDPEEDAKLKKTIANCNFGMLEKQINKTVKSKIFDSYEDAKWFQVKYGGSIRIIKQYEERTVKGKEDDVEFSTEVVPTENALYILNISAESTLTNGFRYIKELLMQHHNFYLNKCRRLLEANDIGVYTVKTDAFTIPKACITEAKELLNFGDDIGCWRTSKWDEDDGIKFPTGSVEMKENTLIEVRRMTVEPISLTIADEYNTDKLCELFEKHRRVMIRAKFPGCGKSYACERMQERGHAVLFVAPTNKLASNYGQNGCTINRFFSIGMTDQSKMAKFDDSPYDTIVFDEIFFSSVRKLARIKRYMDTHPEKIILSTGDTRQLESIEPITNQHDYDEYYNRCIDQIFPVSMYFQENKRLKNQEDKDLLESIMTDIFDETIPIETTIRKYFKLVKNADTTYNIAYRNSTCASVSKMVRETILKKTTPYEVGEILICRSYFKMKRLVFNVNYEYTITAIDADNITLNESLEVPLSLIKKNFIHNYTRTCHSFQGSSIDGPITVFDWKFAFVNRKWVWTAITRARDLKKVYFHDYDENQENIEKMMQYFQRKVDAYKYQDKRAKRETDGPNYITKEWLFGCIGKGCGRCGDNLTYERVGGKIDCNLTAQRLNCSIGHYLDNVVGYCQFCNMAVSNRE